MSHVWPFTVHVPVELSLSSQGVCTSSILSQVHCLKSTPSGAGMQQLDSEMALHHAWLAC